MSQGSKITLAIIITAIVVGSGVYFWQNSQQESPKIVSQQSELKTYPQKTSEISTQQAELKTYSGDSFTAQYPSNYQASKDNLGIVTISGVNSKIMIGDFEPAAAPAPTPDMTQEQLDEFPKNIQYHGYEGKIASAIFYKTGDDSAKKELEAIQASIKLK